MAASSYCDAAIDQKQLDGLLPSSDELEPHAAFSPVQIKLKIASDNRSVKLYHH
jgi:hypothetical protein